MEPINKSIIDRIDEFCQSRNKAEGRRTHLGASVIGEDCERKIWYGFRWAATETYDGRMLRLFSRGHFEEPRFVEYLRGIGIEVWAEDENGKQFRIGDVMGHFGGSCDGKIKFPEGFRFPELPADWDYSKKVLFEAKTSGAKYFPDVVKHGVEKSKPQHWAQMCVYGFKMGLTHALYMMVNKDTDALHVEFVKLSHSKGREMIALASGIITDPRPPMARYDKNHRKCGNCAFRGPCHFDKPFEKNCRSCRYSQPVMNGEWACHKHVSVIPKEHIETGCDLWEQLDNV